MPKASTNMDLQDKSPWESIYKELKEMAHRQLRREGRNITLSTTGLVHEAYLRLYDETALQHNEDPEALRRMYYGYAARAMRHILVDLARRRNAQKRNNGVPNSTLEEDLIGKNFDMAGFDPEFMLDIDRLMKKLEKRHERWARVVEFIYFGGLTQAETAVALEIHPKTVERDWRAARNWLYKHLSEKEEAVS